MPRPKDDYDTARVPPATPPAIDPDAKPVDARELARDNGDSDADGHSKFDRPGEQSEIDKEREAAMREGERHEGEGESQPELDALPPD
ncbi:hypothetical protein MKP08_06625 [Erythrobacter sp. LQ02-29]|uniref:hypothetical protein n=1 Tax=Erythrobacter sp. LQ02-29 TaxID=2920384 RepID=UPI001F4E4C31|nr:hypothetical protein [Erythrobacter sp. LQ02-29]MCP9222419.1 hypothetical protein [Erythrobacter sp. LQ02-29]